MAGVERDQMKASLIGSSLGRSWLIGLWLTASGSERRDRQRARHQGPALHELSAREPGG